MAQQLKPDAAWRKILNDTPQLLVSTSSGNTCQIVAQTIKQYREPRLMTKHDTQESVPEPLKKEKLGVLSVSRSRYEIGQLELFHTFESIERIRPERIQLKHYETLPVDAIASESNAINALTLSGALDSFLDTPPNDETFNGRMSTGQFEFDINNPAARTGKSHISVDRAQLEIDAGFENDDSIIIMEAKNVIHDNFNVHQLYYPYRRYFGKVKKPIRLVFSQYTDFTYNLYEYRFEDPNNYSSIQLVRNGVYTFSDQQITADDLAHLRETTPVRTDDNQECTEIPFIQADRFDRIISLMERLNGLEPGCGMTTSEIAQFMGTTDRQAGYYPAAGEYLGVFTRGRNYAELSKIGRQIMACNYYDRQRRLAELMFQHATLNEAYRAMISNGRIPSQVEIVSIMLSHNVCNGKSTVERRAQSVIGWMKWLQSLTDEDL